MRLEGVVSKRRDAPYRFGKQSEWIKVKCAKWREANRERWRLFVRR
jgi:bifunctional non-homologous end joining protein LigD